MIYLNGEYMPIEEARIPVLDRGFIFGDGIYEYVPVFDRMPFRLHEHYARLVKSLATVKIPNPFTEAQLGAVVHKLIDAHPWPNQGVYVHITRGVAPRDHSFPPDITPTVFVMSNPLAPTSRKHLEEGLSVVVREDIRWLRCDVKSISLLGHCMLRTEATEEGCDEVILVRDGFLTEASASNILIVSNDMVLSQCLLDFVHTLQESAMPWCLPCCVKITSATRYAPSPRMNCAMPKRSGSRPQPRMCSR